jgi:predicted Fe-Mo cluster-binding NifX family protein
MYIVRYYLTGGTFTSKLFNTFGEATTFSVYQVKTGDVHSVDLIR